MKMAGAKEGKMILLIRNKNLLMLDSKQNKPIYLRKVKLVKS